MTSTTRTQTIVFIHGLFMNPVSWEDWVHFFQERGYRCYAPAYPFHDGNPAELRQNIDPRLATLTLGQVVDSLAAFIDTLPEKPILVGHSMGGLVVQKLIGMDKGVAGVCISSAPPKGIVSFQWSFFKANFPVINPFRGNTPFQPDHAWFHYAFCNTMTLEQARVVFEQYVVPESRNIPRSSTKKDGKLDFKKPHNPLLFLAGEKDHIVPASLNRKNVKAYRSTASRRDFKEFPNKTHFICGEEGWQEVAEYVHEWLATLELA